MHFFYIDESGCNGRDLSQAEQPIFVSGGIIVRDEGWNKTHTEFEKVIERYFENNIPDNFELHTQDLFSPNGTGPFQNHSRERRNGLIHELLDLISSRKHHFCYTAIDKAKLDAYNITEVRDREYVDLKVPYLIAYYYLITTYERHTKEKLGKSARALVIIDEKDSLIDEIEQITNHRRFNTAKNKRIKWIVEFSYPVNSEKNLMIQFSDLFLFLTRKFLEIESGYRDAYSSNLKNIFRDFYRKVDPRIIQIGKTINLELGRNSQYYNDFIQNVTVYPTRRWKTKEY